MPACVCLCAVQRLMVGSGNAPSLTPSHGFGSDPLVSELSSGGLTDVYGPTQGISVWISYWPVILW